MTGGKGGTFDIRIRPLILFASSRQEDYRNFVRIDLDQIALFI